MVIIGLIAGIGPAFGLSVRVLARMGAAGAIIGCVIGLIGCGVVAYAYRDSLGKALVSAGIPGGILSLVLMGWLGSFAGGIPLGGGGLADQDAIARDRDREVAVKDSAFDNKKAAEARQRAAEAAAKANANANLNANAKTPAKPGNSGTTRPNTGFSVNPFGNINTGPTLNFTNRKALKLIDCAASFSTNGTRLSKSSLRAGKFVGSVEEIKESRPTGMFQIGVLDLRQVKNDVNPYDGQEVIVEDITFKEFFSGATNAKVLADGAVTADGTHKGKPAKLQIKFFQYGRRTAWIASILPTSDTTSASRFFATFEPSFEDEIDNNQSKLLADGIATYLNGNSVDKAQFVAIKYSAQEADMADDQLASTNLTGGDRQSLDVKPFGGNPFGNDDSSLSGSALTPRDTGEYVKMKMEVSKLQVESKRTFSTFPNENLTEIAGESGTFTQYLCHPEKHRMLGMKILTGPRSDTLEVLLPLFDYQDESTVMAKEGYAVGAVQVNYNRGIKGLRFAFMKIDGDHLDKKDSYVTQWFGKEPSGNKGTTLAGDGRNVYGIFYSTIRDSKGIGLIVDSKK